MRLSWLVCSILLVPTVDSGVSGQEAGETTSAKRPPKMSQFVCAPVGSSPSHLGYWLRGSGNNQNVFYCFSGSAFGINTMNSDTHVEEWLGTSTMKWMHFSAHATWDLNERPCDAVVLPDLSWSGGNIWLTGDAYTAPYMPFHETFRDPLIARESLATIEEALARGSNSDKIKQRTRLSVYPTELKGDDLARARAAVVALRAYVEALERELAACSPRPADKTEATRTPR